MNQAGIDLIGRSNFGRTRGMTCLRLLLVLAVLSGFGGSWAPAAEPSETARKYLERLRENPRPGVILDRFHAAWFETGSRAELTAFLEAQAEAGTAEDWMILGFVRQRHGDAGHARESFDKAAELAPKSPQTQFWRGRAAMERGDAPAAVEAFRRVRELNPADADLAAKTLRWLGRASIAAGQTEEALRIWDEAIAKAPQDEELREDVAELLWDGGQTDEAIGRMRELIAKTQDPYDSTQRRLRLASFLERTDDRGGALEMLREALGASGRDSWVALSILDRLNAMFGRRDDFPGLAEELERLLEREPGRRRLRERYAATLVRLDRVEEAIGQWREILAKSPGRRELRERFLDLLQVARKWDLAARECQSLLALHPDDAGLILRLARLEHRRGQRDAAIAQVRRFLDAAPAQLGSFRQAADVLAEFEALGKAEAVLREAVANFPDEPVAREMLATHLFAVGKEEEAAEIHANLAKTANQAERVVHSAQILTNRDFAPKAVEILRSREADFPDHRGLLSQLADSARLAGQTALAFEKSRALIDLATTVRELEPALIRAKSLFQSQLADFSFEGPNQQVLQAELLDAMGDRAGAMRVLAKLEASPAARTRQFALFQKMRLQRRGRDWAEAAKTLETLMTEDGGGKIEWIGQMVALHRQAENWEEALKWAQAWKKRLPGQISAWRTEASILKKLGDFPAAAKVLREASRQFEGDLRLLHELGQTYLDFGQFELAEPVFWEIYDLQHQQEAAVARTRTVTQLFEICERLAGGRQALIRRFQQRRDGNRRSIGPVLALAEIYQLAGDTEKWLEALTDVSNLDPENAALRLQLARALEEEGRWEEAIGKLEDVNAPGAAEQIAKLRFFSGDFAGMAQHVMRSLEAGSMTVKRAESSARRLVAAGEFAQAQRIVEALAMTAPDSAKWRLLGGKIALYRAERHRALEQFLAAVECGKHVPEVWDEPRLGTFSRFDFPEMTQLLLQSDARRQMVEPVLERITDRALYLPPNRDFPQAADDRAAVHQALAIVQVLAAKAEEKSRHRLAAELAKRGVPLPLTRALRVTGCMPYPVLAERFPDDAVLLAWVAARARVKLSVAEIERILAPITPNWPSICSPGESFSASIPHPRWRQAFCRFLLPWTGPEQVCCRPFANC